jgi:four helix bundle protein
MPLRHHNLIAWQRADDLFIVVHKLARESFPIEERYELSSQLRRAAYSVAANIVEGYAREH